jgi:hypothetical protein
MGPRTGLDAEERKILSPPLGIEPPNSVLYQLFTDFKKAYYSVMREELYNIITEFSVPMKLFRLIKGCLKSLQ